MKRMKEERITGSWENRVKAQGGGGGGQVLIVGTGVWRTGLRKMGDGERRKGNRECGCGERRTGNERLAAGMDNELTGGTGERGTRERGVGITGNGLTREMGT